MTMENKIVPKPGDTKAPAFDIDANIDKLSDSQKYFYKKFKRVNRERWEVNQIYRRSGRRVGLGLGFFALGICILFIPLLL